MLIGKRISGRYQILRVIGGGGLANVYLAEDIILDREVAIKILRFDYANDNEFIRRSAEKPNPHQASITRILSAFMIWARKMIFIILSWNTLKA